MFAKIADVEYSYNPKIQVIQITEINSFNSREDPMPPNNHRRAGPVTAANEKTTKTRTKLALLKAKVDSPTISQAQGRAGAEVRHRSRFCASRTSQGSSS